MAQGILAGPIAATQASMNIQVKRTGRVRAPKLDDPQLAAIGLKMVAEQKARWARGMDAAGQTAKKLTVRYAIIKQAVLHKRPVRDMHLTGATIKNFQLRKATLGTIRAENTTRLERSKARRCQGYDQMIGFALTDTKVVFDAAQNEFGQYVNKAWIPLDGTNRRPGTLNMLP
ncbi:MAG TPA: hypothetical protein VE030_11245 [Burkholderiales bacterium]|nr:hypothetical protein [Burkholderiales bacterium]